MGLEPMQLAVNDHLTSLLPEANSKHILTAIYQVLVASRTSGLFNMTWIQSIFMYFSCHPCNFRHRNHISTQVLAVRFSSKNEIHLTLVKNDYIWSLGLAGMGGV